MDESGSIFQAAKDANNIEDTANVQVNFMRASCAKHSTKDADEDEDEDKEGAFSTDAHDSLKRYSFEHRQVVVAASTAKYGTKEAAEAKSEKEAVAKKKWKK
jgi:hypothetical protein